MVPAQMQQHIPAGQQPQQGFIGKPLTQFFQKQFKKLEQSYYIIRKI